MQSNNIEITEQDVLDTLGLFTKVPSILLKRWVSNNKNLVKSFEGPIQSYKTQLSSENNLKVKKVLQMPVEDLQEILNKVYLHTGKKQLKILADPSARQFIVLNLEELKKFF